MQQNIGNIFQLTGKRDLFDDILISVFVIKHMHEMFDEWNILTGWNLYLFTWYDNFYWNVVLLPANEISDVLAFYLWLIDLFQPNSILHIL